MEYQKFIEQLPNLSPSSDFQEILNETKGITSVNMMQLLNLAVFYLEEDEIYCQIGCSDAANLIGAMLNKTHVAYAVEEENIIEELSEQLSLFNLEEQVLFCQQNLEEFFFDLKEYQPETKIGVYFLNPAADYRTVLMGLLLVKQFLAAKALIIIHNSNNTAVKQAAWDFLAATAQCELLLELPNYGNGLIILGWDEHKLANYSWGDWIEKYRNESFIQTFSDFQKNWELNQEENTVKTIYNTALELAKSGKLEAAADKYKEILNKAKNHAASWHDLGMVLYQMGQEVEALKAVEKAININPGMGHYYYSLGLVREKLGEKEKAIAAYEQAIKLNPKHFDAYNNLGNIFYADKHLEKAELIYSQAIKVNSEHFGAYLNLFLSLKNLGKTEEARKFSAETAQLFPDDLLWKLQKNLILPILYHDQAEIEEYRQQFTQGLDKSIEEVNLDTPEARQKALRSLENHTNFGLAYQGFNHKKLQQKYGELVQRIMAANFPQLTNKKPRKNLNKNKIRVGYLSGCMRDHVVTKLTLGWLQHQDKNKFDIYSYYLDGQPDKVTELFKNNSNIFRHLPDNLEAVCQQIIADELDILVFLDIGMLPKITLLASLKLAPIQCTTWAHPETSGLSTIDYFLSSDLMEPENAQNHYSEELIRLPNIAISYPKPQIPQPTKTRTDFNLRDDAVVYFCCQSLFKYLPQHDYILATIAQKVPTAQFVFINRPNADIALLFRKRLQGAFAQLKLNFDEYSVFLSSLNREDYLNLNLVADIYLDTISWSGGNTTLEAIACNLPVVTYPGEFMRGRHSYAMLKMLGVTDTIASSEAEYIDIAVRLGNEPQWRANIVEKIKANHSKLYDDTECVRALEKFYQSVS